MEQIARLILALEAAACLWLAYLAWRERREAPLLLRAAGAAIGCGAASIIIYGLTLA